MSLSITHNQFKDYYQSISDYLERNHLIGVLSESEKKECIAQDSIWEIQWYPNTPISFYIVADSTLEKALQKANEE